MHTEIILHLNRTEDIARLIAFLEQSGIAFSQRKRNTRKKSTKTSEQPTLSTFIGSVPGIDIKSFDRYIHDTREEWERNTF